MQDNPQGPDVTFLAVPTLGMGLGRHVGGRAHVVLDEGPLPHDHLAVAEVDQHWLPVGAQKDVRCF